MLAPAKSSAAEPGSTEGAFPPIPDRPGGDDHRRACGPRYLHRLPGAPPAGVQRQHAAVQHAAWAADRVHERALALPAGPWLPGRPDRPAHPGQPGPGRGRRDDEPARRGARLCRTGPAAHRRRAQFGQPARRGPGDGRPPVGQTAWAGAWASGWSAASWDGR